VESGTGENIRAGKKAVTATSAPDLQVQKLLAAGQPVPDQGNEQYRYEYRAAEEYAQGRRYARLALVPGIICRQCETHLASISEACAR
jgi:hypothetical protein